MAPATAEVRLAAISSRARITAPDVDGLDARAWPEPARQAAGAVWRRRVLSETRSVEVALELGAAYRASDCALRGAADAFARLEEDERAHVALCQRFCEQIDPRAPSAPRPSPRSAPADTAPSVTFLRYVLTGLAVCESVSALRFAMVRAHTDLPIPRACIDLFLRDETAHARLGFTVLPVALAHHREVVGAARAARDVEEELGLVFRELDATVGLDAERRGIRLEARPQPADNPGVVEPMLDALAFYRGVERTIAPRLEALGIPALRIWQQRWSEQSET